jgi:hypothetical protein
MEFANFGGISGIHRLHSFQFELFVSSRQAAAHFAAHGDNDDADQQQRIINRIRLSGSECHDTAANPAQKRGTACEVISA